MTSPRSVQSEAASPSTEESEARPRYLQTPSPPPQPFLEVNQYLNDDFLSCMGPLPEFGLEDALPPPVDLQGSFYWSAGQPNGTQQESSASGLPHEAEGSRVPSPLSLEFPDFSDILGMEPLVMEQARPSGRCSGAKQERLSRSPSLLSQQDLRISSNALVCTSWHTTFIERSPQNLLLPDGKIALQVQDSAGDSAATQYHMRALSPGLSPGRRASLLTPAAAPHSPLHAHPVTPHWAPRRPYAIRLPLHAGQPLMHAAQPPSHPDFATIYAFLGSLFDPDLVLIDHADVLAQMAPVDRETACLLMNNMAANIADPAALAAQVEAAGARGPPPPQRGEMVPRMHPEDPPAAQCAHVPAPAHRLQQYGSIPVYASPHTF